MNIQTLQRTFLATVLSCSSIFAFAQASQKLPARKTAEEKQLMISKPKTNQGFSKAGGFVLPSKLRYPGEFEESQAVLISWADGFDQNGPTGLADTTDDWGYVSAQLCDHIQPEAPVWIRVNVASDTTRIKKFMQNRKKPLYNYRFFISRGDGWWMRDFGPNGVYYGDKDSVAFIDLKYYDGRDLDDKLPKYIAGKMGFQNYESTLYSEGGNLMGDGFGRFFFSTMLTTENTDANVHFPVWTANQTYDSLKYLFSSPTLTELNALQCDGGTGHIDLYLKMADEQTLFVAKYPSAIVSQDKQKIEDNYQYLTTLKSTYNRPYRIYRIPHPTDDDGSYTTKTCTDMNDDARTFVNGLTINKTFIYPSYSDGQTGNQAQTDSVTRLFEKLMPGYKIRPVDARTMSPYGGEIHCITMQIPAENPVLFWHPSIDGKQEIQPSYHIIAKISNRSGIASAECKWHLKGEHDGWRSVTLTDSAGFFIGDIPTGALTPDNWFVYYITATTNNGKTVTKPITGADGPYAVYFTDTPDAVGVGMSEVEIKAKNYLFGAYPNPASSEVTIPFFSLENGQQASIAIMNISGQTIRTIDLKSQAGLNRITVEADKMVPGVYFYTYHLNGTYIATRKFIISK